MNFHGKKILVAGGAGYIGSHVCQALSRAGAEPIVYDSFVHGHPWAAQWGNVEKGDLLDTERLEEVFLKYQPDAVMHFAAFINVGESVQKPEKYFKNNVEGSQCLLATMEKFQVQQLIFSSTAAVYGDPQQNPIPETHPLQPVNPYGESKLQIERAIQERVERQQLSAVTFRYFNASGADPASKIGEAHAPETHLIPIVLETALGLRKEMKIYGDDYPTPDGTCVRDYVHVSDLAQAHLLGLQSLETQPGHQIYNLGSQSGASVREILEIAQKISGKTIPHQIAPRRPGDPAVLVADSTKVIRDLHWKPEFPQLEPIIETAWNWLRTYQTWQKSV